MRSSVVRLPRALMEDMMRDLAAVGGRNGLPVIFSISTSCFDSQHV